MEDENEFIKKITACVDGNADDAIKIIMVDPDVVELMQPHMFAKILYKMDETNHYIDKEMTRPDTDLKDLRYARACILVMNSYNNTRLETIEARIKILKEKGPETAPDQEAEKEEEEHNCETCQCVKECVERTKKFRNMLINDINLPPDLVRAIVDALNKFIDEPATENRKAAELLADELKEEQINEIKKLQSEVRAYIKTLGKPGSN